MGKRSTWKLVVGIIGVVLGLIVLIAGLASMIVFGPDGRFTSGREQLTTTSSAFVSTPIDVISNTPVNGLSGVELQLRIRSTNDGPVFIGIGPEADVNTYLQGVATETIDSIDFAPFRYETTAVPGDRPADPPSGQTFWLEQVEGPGEQTLNWEVRDGTFRVVVMNADGAAAVDIDGRFGIEIPWIFPVGIVLTVIGAILLAGGILLIIAGSRRRPVAAGPGQYGAPPTGQYGAPPTGQYGAQPAGQQVPPPPTSAPAPVAPPPTPPPPGAPPAP